MRRQKRQRRHLTTKLFERLTRLPYSSLFTLWLSLAVIFGVGYFLLGIFIPEQAPSEIRDLDPLHMLYNSLYFSVITATSTGYGDITPDGISKALASMQSIGALLVFAVFVTKLVSHRQEVALQEVHRLTFEDVFHNTREGLYIIRKDCDRIIRDAEEHQSLNEDHWNDLVIVYRQAQSLLNEIPDFYSNEDGTDGRYTIDEKRELLLQEAVGRTLKRINQMLDVLSRNNVDWASHASSMNELRALVEVVHKMVPDWQRGSPYNPAFEDIIHAGTQIHGRIRSTVET